ncbi:MAG: 3-hydroxyacyl-CoA dehydrogenase/enoyl-CoA hydratase family protein [Deltaproteobacteria bacterium]|nr:3-hydroxyacyl-CoA dehydrogenase/enoyl-CoA hydratase family protein [Deltaproteobacteria bacterium]
MASASETLHRAPIRRAGVIGAGVMGSGIAAHFANAGVEVVLLDIVPPNLTDKEKSDPAARNRFSAGGLEKALKSKPAAFFHKSAARLVTVGNTEDDLGKLANCDLVIEAVIEQMEAKQALFAKLESILPEGCVIASNTSGLRIEGMTQGRSASFKSRFLVMHFFNPVRYMKLLELVSGPETSPAVFARIKHFGEDVLGKGIVVGKDTPNFVGNRIGTHAMLATIHLMIEEGLSPEDIDNITGKPMGHPKSASFRTADLVGLDTFAHVAKNCFDSLTNDEERDVFKLPAFIQTMLEKKLLGDKTKGGFYKKGASKKDLETFDPKTLAYRPKAGDETIKEKTKELSKIEDVKERVRALAADEGPAGKFAWKVTARSLAYSARRIPEIAEGLAAVDDAMKWGYNWELGPFETWDALGFAETAERIAKTGFTLPQWVSEMKAKGATSFYKGDEIWSPKEGRYVSRGLDPRTATFEIMKRGAPVLTNDGADAFDLGDGVLGLTFKTKANTIDADVIGMLQQAVAKAESDFKALVIANTGENFSVGANLGLVLMAAMNDEYEQIRAMVKSLHEGMQRMKYARVPVVAAPYGYTFGGGLELCLASSAVQAAAETYAGLVEVGVGIIPGGAGTMNMLWRALEGVPEGTHANVYEIVTGVFKNIALAKVATSAEEAKQFGYFRKNDGVSFDRARQLTEVKKRALGLADSGWHPPLPKAYTLPGESGMATLGMMVDTLVAGGYASEHDAKISRKLAEVLCGGVGGAAREVTEEEMLELEREAFLSLCGEPKSQERMQHMLMKNKPLRN